MATLTEAQNLDKECRELIKLKEEYDNINAAHEAQRSVVLDAFVATGQKPKEIDGWLIQVKHETTIPSTDREALMNSLLGRGVSKKDVCEAFADSIKETERCSYIEMRKITSK